MRAASAMCSAAAILVCAGLIGSDASQAAARAQPNLQKLALTGGQIGAGYRLLQRRDGHGTSVPTLDLCGFDLPSERLRTNRVQVNYVKRGAPITFSNEVVVYRPGGTAAALRDLRRAVKTCPKGPVPSKITGVPPLTYRMSPIRTTGLLPNAVALNISVSGKINGRVVSEVGMAVYQVRHNALSGVYAYGGSTSARTRIGLHAAAAAAKNLKRGA